MNNSSPRRQSFNVTTTIVAFLASTNFIGSPDQQMRNERFQQQRSLVLNCQDSYIKHTDTTIIMDPASLFSRETMSVAMTHLPKSVPILGGIYKLATDIQETTQRVAVNQKQSEQLSERIDTLVGFLAQRDFSEQLSEAMHIALQRFETFLRQCLEFIETFVETSWFKRVIGNKEHERKFVDLNRELTQYSNDLNFGIGLSNMPSQKKLEPDEKEDNRSRSPSQTNSHERRENIFISGLWQYQYNQYNQWFGPFQHQITFNPMTKTLQGYGEDNVGQYALGGSFSVSKGRIELIQQYQPGTGDPNLNLGHRDTMQLTWNAAKRLFEGVACTLVGGCYTPGSLIIMSLVE